MIEIKKLSGGYSGVEAAHDIFPFLPDGQATVVIDPNDYGRSTLFNLCCDQLHQTQGEVLAGGESLSVLSHTNIARTIAPLPQSRTIPDIMVGALAPYGRFPWLGYPHVCREEDKVAAENVMARTGIQEKSHELLVRLSGRERQEIYLVMLLAQNTGYILLGESTTYLNINHQLQLFSPLTELKQEGECAVTVLRDLDTALEPTDQVVVTRRGRLLTAETPEQVILSDVIEGTFGVKIGRRGQYTLLR